VPFGAEGIEPGTGLALSGGGFRATLFHCGVLWCLNELGFVANLDRGSSASGGSITAGVLATRWKALRFESDIAVNLREEVIAPLRAFCHRNVDVPAIGLGALLPGRRASDELQAAYAEHQSRGLPKRVLVDDYTRGERKGAYGGIDTDIRKYGLADALPVLPSRIQELSHMRTRLNDFSDTEQGRLINWGYAVCDASMRRHVTAGAGSAAAWPVPELRLDQ
jgi:Patatin-like phospholipase